MLCTIIAIKLTIIAFVSLYDSAVMICQRIVPPGVPVSLISIINAHLLMKIIIIPVETVTVYFVTKYGEVRALPVAGPTVMVRHLLVYNTAGVDPMILSATFSPLAALNAEIVPVKP